jgi:hypothetical protein
MISNPFLSPNRTHEVLSAQLLRSSNKPCQISIPFANTTDKRKVELPILALVSSS